MSVFGNEDIRRGVIYYCVHVLEVEPYGFTYFDDIITEQGFIDNGVWSDPMLTLTWAQVSSVLQDAYDAYHYEFDTLTPTEMKDHFAALDTSISAVQSDISDLQTAAAGIPATFDDLTDGSTNKAYTSTEKTKLGDLPSASALASSLAAKATLADIVTAIAALVNSAPGAMDTLAEIAAIIASDESTAAALATTVAGKVDKVTGKGLSANDFTDVLKAKLDGIDVTGRTVSNPSRSLNTAFQPSTTNDALVTYSVDITLSSGLLGTTAGTVTLQYADDSGQTTNVKTLGHFTNSIGGLLNATNVNTAVLQGYIPTGKYVKLISSGTNTPAFGSVTAQELTL